MQQGTKVIQRHRELPVTSIHKIDFNKYDLYRAESLPLLSQVHGMLMMTSWIFFAGLTTVISRYYRGIFSNKEVLGTKLWFQLHRGSGVLTILLTGDFCQGQRTNKVFVRSGNFMCLVIHIFTDHKVAVNHGWVGIALMSASVLQVIGGIARPGPKSDCRLLFNWIHILAAVAGMLAFNRTTTISSQQKFGTVVVATWCGAQVIWEVIFEIRKRCMKDRDKKTSSSLPAMDRFFLVLYVITLCILLCGAGISIFGF